MSAGRFSGLGIRIVSGLVLAPLIVCLIWLGGWFFTGLMVVGAVIAFYEWYRLSSLLPDESQSLMYLMSGMIYLIVCFCSYIFLRFAFDAGAWLAICMMLCVWSSDTGAYFAGKFIGGPKMAPRISPNKTWAGLGGAVGSCGLALVILLFVGHALDIGVPLDAGKSWFAVFMAGAVLGVVGQAGDLSISLFKRRVGVKDSGVLIPGHGGLLDRIDALLLVSPVFLAFCLIFLS